MRQFKTMKHIFNYSGLILPLKCDQPRKAILDVIVKCQKRKTLFGVLSRDTFSGHFYQQNFVCEVCCQLLFSPCLILIIWSLLHCIGITVIWHFFNLKIYKIYFKIYFFQLNWEGERQDFFLSCQYLVKKRCFWTPKVECEWITNYICIKYCMEKYVENKLLNL